MLRVERSICVFTIKAKSFVMVPSIGMINKTTELSYIKCIEDSDVLRFGGPLQPWSYEKMEKISKWAP